jgi:hypothetical protein
MRRFPLVLLAAVLSACHGRSGSITTPSALPLDLSGTWTGSGSDSSGRPANLTWRATQSGSDVTGPVTATTGVDTVVYMGTLNATLNGTSLSFTIAIPRGGMASPLQDCLATLTGTAIGVTFNSIEGSYAGANSCTGPVTNGIISLSR